MARPLRIQYPDAYYHVACRGNAKRPIFLDNHDRHKFLELLVDSLLIYEVVLHAYILMNNHFHLLLQTPKANLSEFMRRFNICYTGWFNFRHNLYGHLYQGRYKAILIDADSYLLELSRYIHLNIIRSKDYKSLSYSKKIHKLKKYQWSSLPGYLKKTKIQPFVCYDFILSIIKHRRAYNKYISDSLLQEVKNPFENRIFGCILGKKAFINKLRREHSFEGSGREQPQFKEVTQEVFKPETIIQIVGDTLSLSKDDVLKKRGNDTARAITAELLYRFSSMKQSEIGDVLGGVDYSAVSHMRRRFKKLMTCQKNTDRCFRKILEQLGKPYSLFKI